MKTQNIRIAPLLILLFVALLFSQCNRPRSENSSSEEAVNNCLCFGGIGSAKGDKPNFTFTFSTGETLAVCGYLHNDEATENIMSEFDIFHCQSGESLLQYDATLFAQLIERPDTLLIRELVYLPSGENWEWELFPIKEQFITPDNGGFRVSEPITIVPEIQVDKERANTFLASLKKGSGITSDSESEVIKLCVLTLAGYEKAQTILENYEEFIDAQVDGALSQVLKESLILVNLREE